MGAVVPEQQSLRAACHILPVVYLWVKLSCFLFLLRLELGYKKPELSAKIRLSCYRATEPWQQRGNCSWQRGTAAVQKGHPAIRLALLGKKKHTEGKNEGECETPNKSAAFSRACLDFLDVNSQIYSPDHPRTLRR